MEEKEEIVSEYGRYYKELLKVRPPECEEEEKIEQNINDNCKKYSK